MLLDYVRTEQAHRALLCIVSPDINIYLSGWCANTLIIWVPVAVILKKKKPNSQ